MAYIPKGDRTQVPSYPLVPKIQFLVQPLGARGPPRSFSDSQPDAARTMTLFFTNWSGLNEGFVSSDTTFPDFDLPSSGLQTKPMTRPVPQCSDSHLCFLCLLNLTLYRSYKGTLRTSRVIHPKVSFFQVKRGAGWIMLPAENTSRP